MYSSAKHNPPPPPPPPPPYKKTWCFAYLMNLQVLLVIFLCRRPPTAIGNVLPRGMSLILLEEEWQEVGDALELFLC